MARRYDRLAPVWRASTDDNLWNEHLERRPVRELLFEPLMLCWHSGTDGDPSAARTACRRPSLHAAGRASLSGRPSAQPPPR